MNESMVIYTQQLPLDTGGFILNYYMNHITQQERGHFTAN